MQQQVMWDCYTCRSLWGWVASSMGTLLQPGQTLIPSCTTKMQQTSNTGLALSAACSCLKRPSDWCSWLLQDNWQGYAATWQSSPP